MSSIFWTWVDPTFRKASLGLTTEEVEWLKKKPGRMVCAVTRANWHEWNFPPVVEFNDTKPTAEEAWAYVLRGAAWFIRPEDLP